MIEMSDVNLHFFLSSSTGDKEPTAFNDHINPQTTVTTTKDIYEFDLKNLISKADWHFHWATGDEKLTTVSSSCSGDKVSVLFYEPMKIDSDIVARL